MANLRQGCDRSVTFPMSVFAPVGGNQKGLSLPHQAEFIWLPSYLIDSDPEVVLPAVSTLVTMLVVGSACWVMLIVSEIRRRRENDPLKKRARLREVIFSFAGFVGIILSAIISINLVTNSARIEIKTTLEAPINTILVNGSCYTPNQQLASDIKNMRQAAAHHSHPTNSIHIIVNTKNSQVKLTLARDSQNAEEYWVFYPKYKITRSNEVGRVFTASLQEF